MTTNHLLLQRHPVAAAQAAGQRSRRTFLTQLALVTAGSLAGTRAAVESAAHSSSRPSGRIWVGSNIYGWGQYYERMGQKIADHLDDVLSALKEAGYDYLEPFLDVTHPDRNARFADQSRAKGLRPVSIYSGARLHQETHAREIVDKMLAAAKVCREAGFEVLDCNPDPIGRPKTDEELATQARFLDELGAGLSQLGMRLGVHNHMPEMVDHAREFHSDLRHTSPRWVGLCYDVHWVYRGGIPPAEVLPEYGERVVSWHLRQSREGVWWQTLDEGDVDYAAVARFAKEHRLTAPYTVELALEKGTEVTRSVVENHRISREFVRRVFGV